MDQIQTGEVVLCLPGQQRVEGEVAERTVGGDQQPLPRKIGLGRGDECLVEPVSRGPVGILQFVGRFDRLADLPGFGGDLAFRQTQTIGLEAALPGDDEEVGGLVAERIFEQCRAGIEQIPDLSALQERGVTDLGIERRLGLDPLLDRLPLRLGLLEPQLQIGQHRGPRLLQALLDQLRLDL